MNSTRAVTATPSEKNPDKETPYGRDLRRLRDTFATDRTRSPAWRDAQLAALSRMIESCEAEIIEALKADLGKPPMESWMAELSYVTGEVAHCRRKLKHWMRKRRVFTPAFGLPGRSWVRAEPLGVVLVMSAWNYPLQIALAPLASAICAGNCAVIKPSELAPATSAFLARRLPEYLDKEAFCVIEGGISETTDLLRERFDHIIYTGGGAVGRIVMTAAAQHLTPVTLELGGKSPCVVLPDANLEVAARRIAWGRFMNAGQTCIAPDYLMTDAETETRLLPLLEKSLREMFGEDSIESNSYGRIINARHFERVSGLIEDDKVAIGGRTEASDRYIEPTVLTNVTPESPCMREEIFGPVLPIVKINGLEDAITYIRSHEKPLAAYLFTRDRSAQREFEEKISAGSMCMNDVLMFSVVPELPFGGVGESGMGGYKGEKGFLNFSHLKAVMKRSWWPDVALRYAPYTDRKFNVLKRLR